MISLFAATAFTESGKWIERSQRGGGFLEKWRNEREEEKDFLMNNYYFN